MMDGNMNPFERMVQRLPELIEERDTLTERVAEIQKEIERIQAALETVRENDTFGESSRFSHLYLKEKTLAEACAAVLRETGQSATARDLTNVLFREGRWASDKESNLIGVIQILKRRTDLFEKAGPPAGGKQAWKLTNRLLPEAPAKNGHDANGSLPKPAEAGKS